MTTQTDDEGSLRAKADQGDTSAMVSYATLITSRDPEAAFRWLCRAADLGGVPAAWTRLGKMYSRGKGCTRSNTDAAHCYKRAYRLGDPAGQGLYAMCLITGTGLTQNVERGIAMLREVAEAGDHASMQNLSWLYSEGRYMPANKDEARRWRHAAKAKSRGKHVESSSINRSQAKPPSTLDGVMEVSSSKGVDSIVHGESRLHDKHRGKSKQRSKTRLGGEDDSSGDPTSIKMAPQHLRTRTPEADTHALSPELNANANVAGKNVATASTSTSYPKDTAVLLPVEVGSEHGNELETFGIRKVPGIVKETTSSANEHLRESPNAARKSGNASALDSSLSSGMNPSRSVSAIVKEHEENLQRRDELDLEQLRERRRPPDQPQIRLPSEVTDQEITDSHSPKAERSLAPETQPFSNASHLQRDQRNLLHQTSSDHPNSDETCRENHRTYTSSAAIANLHSQEDRPLQAEKTVSVADSIRRFSGQFEENGIGSNTSSSDKMEVTRRSSLKYPTVHADERFHEADDTTISKEDIAAVPAAVSNEDGERQSYEGRYHSQYATGKAPVDTQNLYFSSSSNTFNKKSHGTNMNHIDRRESEDLRRTESKPPVIVPASPVTPAPGDGDALVFERVQEVHSVHQDVQRPTLSAYERNSHDSGVASSSTFPIASNNQSTNRDGPSSVSVPSDMRHQPVAHAEVEQGSHETDTDFSNSHARDTDISGNIAERRNNELVNENPLRATDEPIMKNGSYMDRARTLSAKLHPDALNASSADEAFEYLHEMQELAWKSGEAGIYLVRQDGLGATCRLMQLHPRIAGVQERGIHSLTRLIRAAEPESRESLILGMVTFNRTMDESSKQTRYDESNNHLLPRVTSSSPSRRVKMDPIMTIVKAMRAHTEVMTVQMAGCNVLAEFMSVSLAIREHAVTCRGHRVIVDALRVKGRTESFDLLYLVHEMACRALSELCRSSNSDKFKEAVGEETGVEQVIASIGRWTAMETMPTEERNSVTRHGCAALRYLTHHCERNAWRGINANGLLVLVSVLETHNEQAAVCLGAIAAMTSIAVVSNDSAKQELEDSDGLPCILGVVRRHSDNPVLVRKGLQCLRMFVTFGSQSRRRAIELGAVETTLVAMRKYSDDARVQEQACGSLALICRDEPVAKDLIATSAGVTCVTEALNKHRRDVSVAEYGALAISSMCAHHQGNQEIAMQVDTPASIVACLKLHGVRHTSVAIMTSSAMRVLALSKVLQLSQRLLDSGAPELLLNTMKGHVEVSKVQEHASFALSAMCARNDSLSKRIMRHGAIEILLESLNRYIAISSVVYAVVCAIRSMVSKSREVVLQYILARLPSSLQKALSHHMSSLPQNDNVVIVICATLNVCAFKIVANKNEIGAAGIIEQLRDLISIASEKQDEAVLHPTLSTLCTLLINSTDNQDRFQEVGGVEAVLEILARWRRNVDIVELCCVVLRHSCGEHDGNRDDIKANNGIRTLQGALHNHPGSAAIITAACQALAVICHGDSELQTSAGMLETIPTTVSAMENFQENPSVQAGACSFLFAVTQNNPRNKARTVRCGGRSAIVRALEMHPGNAEVTNYGAHALLQVQDTTIPGVPEPSDTSSMSASETGSEGDGSRRGLFRVPRRWSRDSRSSRNTGDDISSGSSGYGEGRHRRRFRRRGTAGIHDAPEMQEFQDGSFQQIDQDCGDAFEAEPAPARRRGNSWMRKKMSQNRESMPDGGGGGFSFARRSARNRDSRRRIDLRGAAMELDDNIVEEGVRHDQAAQYRDQAVVNVDDDNDIARMRDLDDLGIDEIVDETEPVSP